MSDEFYTLADMVKFTGGTPRIVQHWAERGAIRAEPETEGANTGTHRRFSRTEAVIACILHGFARRKTAIGELIDIGEALRRFLARKDDREHIEMAMEGDVPVYLMMTSTKPRAWKASLVTPANQKQAAAAFEEATSHLDADESMTHIIKLNTYLRRV